MTYERFLDESLKAPAPMEALKKPIESENNLRIIAAMNREQPFEWHKRLWLEVQILFMKLYLFTSSYRKLSKERDYLQRKARLVYSIYKRIKITSGEERQRLIVVYKKHRHWLDKWKLHDMAWRKLGKFPDKLYDLEMIQRRDNERRRQAKQLKKLSKELKKEAMVYHDLIVDRLTSLGYYQSIYQGPTKPELKKKIVFSEVRYTVERVYYLISTGRKNWLGRWKTTVPAGVHIGRDIMNGDTMDELTLATQRVVTGKWNADGAWIVMDRFRAADADLKMVRYSDVMKFYNEEHKSRMDMCLGAGQNSTLQWMSLADYPHWLIGGYTGTGKSNFVNVQLSTLIQYQSPKDLRLVLIDLKGGLEFGAYTGIPHLFKEIVRTPEAALQTIQEMISLMHYRFEQMRGKAIKYEYYRARYPDVEFPRVLIVFDEFAQLSSDTNKQNRDAVLNAVSALTAMGRAVGIHCWITTQRPSTEAVPGHVKINVPLRVAFRMPSAIDSNVILGNKNAKELSDTKGRAIVQTGPDPIEVQVPFLSPDEHIEAIRAAHEYAPAAAVEIPEQFKPRGDHWTHERVIAYAIDHMTPSGLLSARRIWEDVRHESNVSFAKVKELIEEIWAMEYIVYENVSYHVVRRRGGGRILEKIQDSQIQGSKGIPALGSSLESLVEPLTETFREENVNNDHEHGHKRADKGAAGAAQGGDSQEEHVRNDSQGDEQGISVALSQAIADRFGTARDYHNPKDSQRAPELLEEHLQPVTSSNSTIEGTQQ